jgi:hypothetical protein
MVDLPTLDAASGAALGKELATVAAAEKKLPPSISRAQKRLEAAAQALNGALEQSLSSASDGVDMRGADLNEKATWAAIEGWLSSWARLPSAHAQVASAQTVHAALFPDGLKWLRLGRKQEWSEAERRLRHIQENKLDAAFAQLGGAHFLETLRTVHARFGEALGITVAKPAPPAPAGVGEKLDALKAALRGYVLQATAWVDEEAPETAALAERLLLPLSTWQTNRAARAPVAPPPPAGAGASSSTA